MSVFFRLDTQAVLFVKAFKGKSKAYNNRVGAALAAICAAKAAPTVKLPFNAVVKN